MYTFSFTSPLPPPPSLLLAPCPSTPLIFPYGRLAYAGDQSRVSIQGSGAKPIHLQLRLGRGKFLLLAHTLSPFFPPHPAGRISLPCTMVLDREAQSTILRPDKLAINWPVGFTTSRSHINERLRETSLPRTPPRLCPLWENQLAGHPVEWVHCDGSLCGSPGSMGLFVLWIIQQASPALNNRGLYCMFNQLGRENQYVCQINSAWPWCASGLFGRIWKLTLGNGPPLVPLIWSLSW